MAVFFWKLSRSTLKRVLPKNDWGDAVFSWAEFRRRHGRFPCTTEPTFFNDHLYNFKVGGALRDPLRTFVTDKEFVKYYIAAVVGWEYVIKTYRVLRSRKEVGQLQLERFPCVVKPTHVSGIVEIHRDPSKPVNHGKLKEWLAVDYYLKTREPNYRGLRPKIIVEELISDDGSTVPDDYKVFCLDGVPKFIQVDSDRFSGHTRNLYDTKWTQIPIALKYPNAEGTHPRPPRLEQMLDLAARLSLPFPFIRVDLYATGDRLKIGELTSCPDSAGGDIRPPSGELVLGRLLTS